MKVFLTEPGSFVGLATARELLDRGHHVYTLEASEKLASKMYQNCPANYKNISIFPGSMKDDYYNRVTETAAMSDGVIHLAYNQDITATDQSIVATQNSAVLDALFAGLRRSGTEKPLVVASSCAGLRAWGLLKPGDATLKPLTETDQPEKLSARVQSNESVVHAPGIRGIVMRLPPAVHGKAVHGKTVHDKADPEFVRLLQKSIVKEEFAFWLGDGTNRWPATHVNDAAAALVLALEKGPRGYLHAVAEEGVAFKEIVEALGAKIRFVKAEKEDLEMFQLLYGSMAGLFSEDHPTSGKMTQEILSWTPKEVGLLQDIRDNY